MTSGYLLDTDTVSYALRIQGQVGDRLRVHHPSEIHVSSITVAELQFGVARRNSRSLQRVMDAFLEPLQVLPLDETAARRYGAVAASLEHVGMPIGQFDTLIAAQALTHKLTLVSNNTKHFSRVPGLKLENWL